MKLTTKGKYAIQALVDLVLNSKSKVVNLEEIAAKQNISRQYLEQLFRKLRIGNVVKSVRGPGGGYVLDGDMNSISLKHILNSVDERVSDEFDYLKDLDGLVTNYLEKTTLGDVVRKA